MQVIIILFSLFSLAGFASEVCTFTQNVDGVINSIAEGNSKRAINPESPIMYQRAMDDVTDQREVIDGLKLTQQRYNDYYKNLERGTVRADYHIAVQNHLREQMGEGYIRALKPGEVAEIMRDGRTQSGIFFSNSTGGAHVGHNRSAIYVRCIKDCDQYFTSASTGSGVQNLQGIPRENLEIIVPDYDAAMAAARNPGRASGATASHADDIPTSGGMVVEEIEDVAELGDEVRSMFKIQSNQIDTSTINDFVKNGQEMNGAFGVFNFDKATAKKLAAAGRNNGGVIKVSTQNGETMIVKALKDPSGSSLPLDEILQEVRNAQKMNQLGIGPEAHLMKTKSGYSLVMKESPGLNVKELLNPRFATKDTQKTIDAILGVKTQSLTEARMLYAQRILKDEKLLAEMRRVGGVLDSNQVNSMDFQMMIHPSNGAQSSSAQVIDTAMYEYGHTGARENRNMIDGLIGQIRNLAAAQ